MARMIFVNLPVEDLGRAVAFYKSVGAEQNMQFSDETAASMVLSDVIHVMLLTHDKFRQFTPKNVADARRTTEVLLALSCESRAEVDRMTEQAIAGEGREPLPLQDHGWMYSRSFEDPDGHIWEPFWMDMDAMNQSAADPAEPVGA